MLILCIAAITGQASLVVIMSISFFAKVPHELQLPGALLMMVCPPDSLCLQQ